MGGVVPIFSDPDWMDHRHLHPGAEMAMQTGESFVDGQLGLDWDIDREEWVSPRAEALRNKKIRVEDLDDEELQRGQVRDPDGKFRNGPLRQIPREFHDELMRRILARGTEKLEASYLASIELLTDIVEGKSVETVVDNRGVEHKIPASMTLRSQTARYIIERLAGKTPDKVEVAVSAKPWEVTMRHIVRTPSQEVIEDAVIVADEHAEKLMMDHQRELEMAAQEYEDDE